MRAPIEAALAGEFAKWPDARGGTVTDEEIARVETSLRVTLPEDFRELLRAHGAALVRGHSILGLKRAPLAPDEPHRLDEQTIAFRQQLPADYATMVVIEVDDSGNPIGFIPPNRTVFVFDHSFGGRHDLAPTFEDYLATLLREPS